MIFFGKVNKNDGALLADLKRGIRRWCEPDISGNLQLILTSYVIYTSLFAYKTEFLLVF